MSAIRTTIVRAVMPFVSPHGSFIIERGVLTLEIVSDEFFVKSVGKLNTYQPKVDGGKVTLVFSVALGDGNDPNGPTRFVSVLESHKPEQTERIEAFIERHAEQQKQVEDVAKLVAETGNEHYLSCGEGRILHGRMGSWIAGVKDDELEKKDLTVVEKVEWRLMPRQRTIELVDDLSLL